MPESTTVIYLIVAVTIVLFILAAGIILAIVIQQRKLFSVQQRNLETLAESEERYRRLLKFSPIPMAVLSGSTIKYINDAGSRLIGGVTPEDTMERSIKDFLHPQFYDRVKIQFGELIENNDELSHLDEKLVRSDGEIIDIEVSAIPTTYAGEPSIQILARDITLRKKEEAELIAAKERAEQSDQLKDAFIANISHELRTPLNVILGYSSLINSEFEDRIRPEEREFFESIERGGQRLMRTVEHILNISSIQVGTFELKPELIDINARIEKLVTDMKSFADEKGLTLETTSDCRNAQIYGDRYCIDQALSNLIDNAIKFTNRGGVEIHSYCQDQRVCIAVKDSGIGISAEYLPKVFTVFSQEVSGYTRPFEGLGLGLALTKRYIEMNDGSLVVKSRKGQGTVFTLRFLSANLYDETQEELPLNVEENEEEAVREELVDRSQKTILVVEDDEQTQNYMRIILGKHYNVKLAASGKEAWSVLQSTFVDLILMDLSLRGDEDGLQLTRRIRKEDSFLSTPIIALTAHAFPEDKQKSLEAGCNGYFSKPFDIEVLKSEMQELLSKT